MAKPFIPSQHPVHRLPTAAEAVAMGDQAYAEFILKRERRIAMEKADPLRHFWEPPVWWLTDCLLGMPWVDKAEAEKVRRKLGFNNVVKILTMLGGNRAGKTEYCVSRTLRLSLLKGGFATWFWHESFTMSIDTHQVVFYRYLPPELKQKSTKTEQEYIAYKRKTGFSEQAFILPAHKDNGELSWVRFKSYGESTIEGIALDLVVLDELTGREANHADIAETIPLRTADRNGILLKPFTPVGGYSETVRQDLDGAETVLESVAYLSPKDGGDPLLHTALGLSLAELEELREAQKVGRSAHCQECRPEDFRARLLGDSPLTPALSPEGARELKGREFELVPRVMRCIKDENQNVDGDKAVIFYHSADNPFGRPRHVYARTVATKNNPHFIKERLYGVAHKLVQARFKFDRKVHVVAANEIPPPRQCTNYNLGDPHSRRNMFLMWFSVTPEHVYVYREWPGDYYIPGVGHPGRWALPGKKPDGQPGPAQRPFGWGLRDYKRELARLEGWKDYKAERPADMSEEDWKHAVDSWDEAHGTREPIEDRELDARFASTPRMEKDRPVTLLTEFDDIGMTFNCMPGDDIDTGLVTIDDALQFDDSKPVDFWNQPRLLISSECVNTIYALETWTGVTKEGKTDRDGATKEPIDLLKGFFLRDRPYLGGSTTEDTETQSEFQPTTERSYY